MQVKKINAYEKNGRKFVCIVFIENGIEKTIFLNYGLCKYALENIQKKGK